MRKYDYDELSSFYKKLLEEVKSGKADELESRLCVAAGHALDLIDIVNDADGDWKLDLTANPEDTVPMSVTFVHMRNLAAGKNSVESREDIVKKLVSYELFALHNEIQKAGGDPGFVLEDGVVKVASINPDGSQIAFDPSRAMKRAISRFDLAESPNDGFIAYGTMQPFYDLLMKEFIDKL